MITIIEAKVTPDKWLVLETTFKAKFHQVPRQLKETFLLQERANPDIWMIISQWRSLEDYEEIFKSELYETCMQIFRSAGAHPTRRIFNIPTHHEQV